MYNKLTQNQEAELRNRMRNGTFDSEYEIKSLVRIGYDPGIADFLVNKVVLDFKDELSQEIKESKQTEDKKNVAWCILWASSLFSAMMGEMNIWIILISLVIASFAAYWGFPKRRIAAIAGFVITALMMPFAFDYYLRNKETYMRFELFIPAAVAFGTGLLVKYILSKLMYSDND
ncbi:hypothetical protein [Flavobacterium quisquiliarum]|uniref:Uncharacterized protein n=1 Tax=Flavobacterium quisquiliarum TaxID=1834436 RepID=A0ABV8WBV6_9FLAO|nr:hypothetical protein [Flavobacterium quisquiliarum]MBW1658321.1 hypothetical protein [Flavobacterium quisquiliarum]NWL02150.1 hypothetical protein [Flavobacterium collinsii]